MVDQMLADLDLPAPAHDLATGSGTHGAQTAAAITSGERVLREIRPAAVLVTGAANSTLGFSLAATKLGVPVARIEAGLREHDWSVPEEVNRVLLDTMADLLFASSADAVDNLAREGAGTGRVHLVGSTAADAVRRVEGRARGREGWRAHGLERGRYVLVTLHRPHNVDDDERLARIVEGLAALARRIPVVFPVHPRTADRLAPMGDAHRLRAAGVRCLPPQPYLEFLSLLTGASAVVTDSGTLQEETTALGVPCFTLRALTERTATVRHGTNVLLGDDPRDLSELPLTGTTRARAAIPLWDGGAGARIAAALEAHYALVRA
jgi:UDP-N-acetylglucosamine 2-epimerase (non-hydrolysing)